MNAITKKGAPTGASVQIDWQDFSSPALMMTIIDHMQPVFDEFGGSFPGSKDRDRKRFWKAATAKMIEIGAPRAPRYAMPVASYLFNHADQAQEGLPFDAQWAAWNVLSDFTRYEPATCMEDVAARLDWLAYECDVNAFEDDRHGGCITLIRSDMLRLAGLVGAADAELLGLEKEWHLAEAEAKATAKAVEERGGDVDAECQPIYDRQTAIEKQIARTPAEGFAGVAVKTRFQLCHSPNWKRATLENAYADLGGDLDTAMERSIWADCQRLSKGLLAPEKASRKRAAKRPVAKIPTKRAA